MLASTDRPQSSERYDQVCAEIASVMGSFNVANAKLVELAATVLDEQHHVGPGIHSPAHFLAWRTGLSLGHCQELVRLAKRREELPVLTAALAAGELTVDQAAVVARHVPASYDESATRFAASATVAQLRTALPAYGYEKRTRPVHHGVATGCDDRGWWVRGRLSDEDGAVFDRAMAQAREDLWRKARAEAPDDERVEPISSAEACTAIAESSLRAGEAAHPGSDRYRVNLHLEAAPNGGLQLSGHLGHPLPAATRRRLLCDPTITAVLRQGLSPVSVGRATRIIGRKLRRLIEHRDRGCRVPGCTRTVGLEIHHIRHWEDGGPTDEANLVTLCHTHHRAHHHGALTISGTADRLEVRDAHGHLLEPVGAPLPPPPPPRPPSGWPTPAEEARTAVEALGVTPTTYRCPTGERLRRRDVHLSQSSGSEVERPRPRGPSAPAPPRS